MGGLFWIIQVGPKHHHECPYIRIKGRFHTNTEKAIGQGRDQNDAATSKGTSRNAGSWQKVEEARDGSSPRAF